MCYNLRMGADHLLTRLREPSELLLRLAGLSGAYIVGGWLRDAWWGNTSTDIDLAAPEPLSPVLDIIEQVLGTRPFELSSRFASHRLVAEGYTIDIMPLAEGGIQTDMMRRDYTINAIAVPLAKLGQNCTIADISAHSKTLVDLDARCLRMVSRENLGDDPVRLLRGYRLAAHYGLTPTPDTRKAWGDLAPRLHGSAAERLHEELLRWFACSDSLAETAEWCAVDGVLWQLFPALKDTVTSQQNDFHHLDVWQHTLAALNELEAMLDKPPELLAQWHGELAAAWEMPVSGAASAGVLTRLALLLHDIGKPPTRAVQPDGHVSFHQHQDVGAELVAQDLARLSFAQSEQDFLLNMIREHLRLGFYSDHLPLSPRLVYRFANKLGAATPLMVLHSLADCAATRGSANAGSWEAHLSAAAIILEHYFAQDRVTAPPVLLDGNAIMGLLGIPPGPVVGELKETLLEATAAGDIETYADAEAFLSALWEEKAGN